VSVAAVRAVMPIVLLTVVFAVVLGAFNSIEWILQPSSRQTPACLESASFNSIEWIRKCSENMDY